MTRLAADDERLGGAHLVGGWWPRSNDPEVDLVGVAPAAGPQRVTFVGSVTWREASPFDRADLAALGVARQHVPGAGDAPLVAVSRVPADVPGVACYSPPDLLRAWG